MIQANKHCPQPGKLKVNSHNDYYFDIVYMQFDLESLEDVQHIF